MYRLPLWQVLCDRFNIFVFVAGVFVAGFSFVVGFAFVVGAFVADFSLV
jgi:hypothetical protein